MYVSGDPAQTWLVAAHDAGGAEIVSAWVAEHPQLRYRFVLDGPARGVFARRLGTHINSHPEPSPEWIEEVDAVLTATSYGSDLEWRVRQQARSAGKLTIACLDHWVNYAARFERGGVRLVPDELWVGDETAYLIAREVFPGVRLRLVSNPHLRELRAEAALLEAALVEHLPFGNAQDRSGRILYVTEPVGRANHVIHGNARLEGYDEFDAFRLFLEWRRSEHLLGKLGVVRLRPHPAEPRTKYAGLLAEYADVPVALSDGTTLLEDCIWAGRVVGCSSMAMYVAHILDRPVACAIPAAGAACLLPLPNITYLRDFHAISGGVGT